MRHFIIAIVSLFLLIIQIHAKEKTNQTSSIERLIQQIKNSSSDDRRVVINRLKIELRKMNREAREKVMLDLKKSFSLHHSKKHRIYNDGIMNRPHNHLNMQTQNHIEDMQHDIKTRDNQQNVNMNTRGEGHGGRK